jgi:hypothetical protein
VIIFVKSPAQEQAGTALPPLVPPDDDVDVPPDDDVDELLDEVELELLPLGAPLLPPVGAGNEALLSVAGSWPPPPLLLLSGTGSPASAHATTETKIPEAMRRRADFMRSTLRTLFFCFCLSNVS